MSLAPAIRQLQDKFRDAGINHRLRLDPGEDGVLLADGSVSPPTVLETDGAAEITLSLTLDDLRQMLDGDLNPQMAFLGGRLKVDGDMALAMQLARALG